MDRMAAAGPACNFRLAVGKVLPGSVAQRHDIHSTMRTSRLSLQACAEVRL